MAATSGLLNATSCLALAIRLAAPPSGAAEAAEASCVDTRSLALFTTTGLDPTCVLKGTQWCFFKRLGARAPGATLNWALSMVRLNCSHRSILDVKLKRVKQCEVYMSKCKYKASAFMKGTWLAEN